MSGLRSRVGFEVAAAARALALVLVAVATTALVVFPAVSLGQATPPNDASAPEEIVRRYLEALRKEDFHTAYGCVSKGMRRNKTLEVWVAEVQALLRLSETTISAIRVFPGKIEGDKAFVPNLLHSKDKFINQLGLPEHELYTLVREDRAGRSTSSNCWSRARKRSGSQPTRATSRRGGRVGL